ncbi:MAG: universal stress protein [Alphaproteobacteria bacterium]|nr:universal stress protein [Alphaproteobacteria bacterium]
MRTILAATDGSGAADRAVDFAAALAKTCQASLVLVNVMAIESHMAFDAGFKAMLESERITVGEFLANESRMLLATAKPRAERIHGGAVETAARVGEAADTLIALASEYDNPLIVVGRRGHGRLVGLLLGSVSQKLVTHAPCPVLVVP